MRLSNALMLAGTLGVAFLHTGCGEEDEGNWLTCRLDEFRIEGELGGQRIVILESAAGGGWTQVNGGEFRSQYGTMAQNPARTNLILEWPKAVMNHGASDATGTLTLPTGEPHNGVSYCLGAGTRIHDGANDTFQFTLTGITGTGCTVPVMGELRGCWRPDYRRE